MVCTQCSSENNPTISHFIHCMEIAGEKIEDGFFKLEIAGSFEKIYRERVYCYELYHQLRCLLNPTLFYLHGEIDKSGNSKFKESLEKVKPDFVFHKPGSMERNLVVIEVKPMEREIRQFEEDIEKLKNFICEAGYLCAVFLIYGENTGNKLEEIKKSMRKYNDSLRKDTDSRMLLLWHPAAGERIRIEDYS